MDKVARKQLFEALRRKGFSGSASDLDVLLEHASKSTELRLARTFFAGNKRGLQFMDNAYRHIQKHNLDLVIMNHGLRLAFICGPKKRSNRRVYIGKIEFTHESIRWHFYTKANGFIGDRTLTL